MVVTGTGTVLSGLYIPYTLEIAASNVTVKDVQVVTGGSFAIDLRHTTGATIENSTISGQNATTGRVDSAIDDVYGDSTGMVIKDNNISAFRTAMQISTGLVHGNYIHNPGYIAGDHTNGIVTNGGTDPLTIEDNTIFNSLGQTDAISLDPATSGVPVANKTIENNFLAGGGYSIYGGDGREQHHLQHRHHRQPVRPALLRQERPVRPRRLLQPHRDRATPGPATSGTPPGRPSPPRDLRRPPRCGHAGIAGAARVRGAGLRPDLARQARLAC